MDRPQPVNAGLSAALDDLAWMNRCFGATALVRGYLAALFQPGRELRLLDLATGGADIPRALVDFARRRNCAITIDAVDFHPATLELASTRCASYPEIHLHEGDARTWRYPAEPRRYDAALCTLALHHFSEADAVEILRNLAAQSHTRLALDLERGHLNQALIALLTRTFIRNPMTVNDARLSIQRAFTLAEAGELAHQAGWPGLRVRRHFPARLALFSQGTPAV